MATATLHDGSRIEVLVRGDGPALLLPVNPHPVEGPQAEVLRQYGADPSLGHSLIEGLADVARVVAFDYEGHVLAVPKPDTLTPDNVVADLLAVADAAGADRFVYYGYSWLATVGLQSALRSDRLDGLAMGGWPPIDGPYAEMLRTTIAGYELAIGTREPGGADDPWGTTGLSGDQSRQFVTLYRALEGFDDRAALARITGPRLCLVGSADEIDYGPTWGDVHVSIGGAVVRNRRLLEAAGWRVEVFDGLDHMGAMQADRVVPPLRSWLSSFAAG